MRHSPYIALLGAAALAALLSACGGSTKSDPTSPPATGAAPTSAPSTPPTPSAAPTPDQPPPTPPPPT